MQQCVMNICAVPSFAWALTAGAACPGVCRCYASRADWYTQMHTLHTNGSHIANLLRRVVSRLLLQRVPVTSFLKVC